MEPTHAVYGIPRAIPWLEMPSQASNASILAYVRSMHAWLVAIPHRVRYHAFELGEGNIRQASQGM